MAELTVATCQFPVSAGISANLRHIARQLDTARRGGADVAHFPEGALSGYAGTDFASFDGFDWAGLRAATREVLALARRLRIWVVLGSAHRLTGDHKPHNSLYIIDSGGRLVSRYDKLFCSGDRHGLTGDLAHYSPGSELVSWDLGGVRCGALICYDYRFPELYRAYRQRGVQLMFHSFHAARMSDESLAALRAAIGPELAPVSQAPTFTYPGITMPAAMTAAAASNYVWISCPNSSAPQSCWPAFAVRADGVTAGRLRRNRAGVLLTRVDTSLELYDSTAAWRDRAMAGVLHSGTVVSDPRSADRMAL
jgi:deaminated glutathione amidase